MPRDAEAWLAERGIGREPIRVPPAPPPAGEGDPDPRDPGVPAAVTPVSAREAQQLAQAGALEQQRRMQAEAAATPVGRPNLEDDVAAALAFIRRSTATSPQSVGRLRAKLAERDTPAPAIELAIDRAHAEGFVDDDAFAAAFVEERRRAGHAPSRIRQDLAKRGFDRAVVDRALAVTEGEDLEAAAFAVARDKAQRLTGVAPETAMRRVTGHLARRGYPDGLARKVAREAVFTTRDDQRTAGH